MTNKLMTKMDMNIKEVVCIGCGVVRFATINMEDSERNCQVTTDKSCPVCSCPYVVLKKQGVN